MYTYVNNVGNKIYHRWIDEDGIRRSEVTDFNPRLYVPTRLEFEHDEIFKGIRGEKLGMIEFGSVIDAKNFIKEYSDIDNFEIHGNDAWWAQFIEQKYRGEIDWDLDKLVIANFDIEVLMNDPDNPGKNPIDNPIEGVNPLTAITVEVNRRYIVFGTKDYHGTPPKGAKHVFCDSEFELINKFLTFWQRLAPDIVTGWNIEYFDIPYMIGRIREVLGEESIGLLSPAYGETRRLVTTREHHNGGGIDISIMGLSIMDYLTMYKKFTYKMRERYSLDHIAYVELGERKLDYSEYGNLDDLYNKDYNRYIDYNIRDVELVRRLDDKLNLMMLVLTLTYQCHIRHEDVFSQVRMWDTLIYNDLINDGVVVPPKRSFSKSEKYEGAYVREPEIGMHEWVVSFDLNSLYPHLIMQYNISPEMLVDYDGDYPVFDINDLVNRNADTDFLKDENLSMTANQAFFKRDKQGFLAAMMDKLYAQRKAVKKKMLAAESDVELIKGILKERGHDT